MRVPKLRKNGDGRGFAVYPGSGGKRKYLGKYGTPECERRYREWLRATLDVDLHPDAVDVRFVTVDDVLSRYLDHAEDYYGDSNAGYVVRLVVRQLFEWIEPGTPVRDFGPRALSSWRNHLIARGLARTTVNGYVTKAKRIFRWAQSQQLLPPGHSHDLASLEGLRAGRSRAAETEPVAAVSWAHVQAVLPYVSRPIRGMVHVQFWCGMRPGEVCRMRTCELDTRGDVWLYRPERHKNTHRQQSLVKAIPSVAQNVLRDFVRVELDGFLFRPSDAVRRRGLRPCYTATAYRNGVLRAIAAANRDGAAVPIWTPNQLRHSIATLVSSRFGQQAAQRWLGHARLDSTAIYDEGTLAELVTIARQIDERLAM